MLDRLEAMSVLLAVVETGSLSAASRRLSMPLATVSRKVSELEAHLKTRLFIRSRRGVSLTEAGQGYVAACSRILEDVNEAERAASGEYTAPKGHLLITAPIVFGRTHILPVAIEFLKAYPDVDIRLVLADRVLNLLDDHLDLAVRIGVLPDSSLVAHKVGRIRHVVCASPAYLAKRGIPESPEDLASHDCITFDELMSSDRWRFVTGNSETWTAIHSRLVVNTAEAAIDAAIGGIGVTRVLSYSVAEAVRAGTLAIVLQDFEPTPWPVNLVRRAQQPLPLKLRAFLDFAAPRLKTILIGGQEL